MVIKLPLRQVLLLILVLLVGVPLLVAAQDAPTEDDLLVPLVTEAPTEDDLLVPLSTPVPTEDDLLVPLVPADQTATAQALTPIPTARPRPTVDPVAYQEIPLEWLYVMEGIWTREFGGTTRSGDCSDRFGGDNGGGVRDLGPDDPANQAKLCQSLSAGVIFLDGDEFRWDRTPGAKDVYLTDITIDGYDGSSIQKVMKVIDDYNLDVVTTISDGSCTITYVTHYHLYIPGELFGCSAHDPLIQDVNDQGTPIAPATPEPEQVIIDPIKAGEYTVTWLPFYMCGASVTPTFNTVGVLPTSFDGVSLTVNGETFRLSGEGASGEFTEYGDNVNITLNRRFVNDFDFVWQATTPDNSESCYAQGTLTLTTPAIEQPNFSQPPTPIVIPDYVLSATPAPTMPVIDPIAGAYNITWQTYPGLECPEDLQAHMPSFEQASLVAEGDAFLLQSGAESYKLELMPGASQWMYMEFGEDNSGLTVTFSQTTPGEAVGSFSYFTADGQFCMLAMELRR